MQFEKDMQYKFITPNKQTPVDDVQQKIDERLAEPLPVVASTPPTTFLQSAWFISLLKLSCHVISVWQWCLSAQAIIIVVLTTVSISTRAFICVIYAMPKSYIHENVSAFTFVQYTKTFSSCHRQRCDPFACLPVCVGKCCVICFVMSYLTHILFFLAQYTKTHVPLRLWIVRKCGPLCFHIYFLWYIYVYASYKSIGFGCGDIHKAYKWTRRKNVVHNNDGARITISIFCVRKKYEFGSDRI